MTSHRRDGSPSHRIFEELCGHARQTAVLASVESLLGWDERTVMPSRASGYRADQLALLAALIHRRRTDPGYGARLADVDADALLRDGSPEAAATVTLLRRDFEKHARVPERLVEELARTCVEAQQAWVTARKESSWPTLEPWLERVFDLKRELGVCQAAGGDPYDGLLDDYEPGGTWRGIATQFAALRADIVPLVRACVGASRRPDDALLHRTYPVADQRQFVHGVAAAIGFDFERGRLDTTDHPFCSTMGPHDCRITTRWDERFLPTALYGVLHEAGHGLYEQGLPTEWFGLPPGEAASLGVHESQSRLWENLVGRSAAFWEWCFPLARTAFPQALGDASPQSMHHALLTVRPSAIRVEADEVTYNLHVMMRFDLERAVIHRELDVADLPQAWNDRFRGDFGFQPSSAAEGVLQDIHWSAGLVGYFPTYTLGNIVAAQLMAAANRVLPDLDHDLAAGRFGELLAWLRRHVHAHGRRFGTGELVARASGETVSERWLVQSLRQRYGPVHGVG